MTHSPAPWYYQEATGNIYHFEPDPDKYDLVCADVRKRDVSLIVAAPDLLEACKLAVSIDDIMIRYDPFYRFPDEERETILKAIAKAEGK